MDIRAWTLVLATVVATLPLASAQITHEIGIPPVPPLVGPCQYNVAGDKVGYDASSGFGHTHLAVGVHLAHDLNYLATGVFLGGTVESHDGAEFLVFTIATGFSQQADWCDRIIDSVGLGDILYEDDG